MAGIMTVEKLKHLLDANDGTGDIVLQIRSYKWIGNIDVHAKAELAEHPDRKRNLVPG